MRLEHDRLHLQAWCWNSFPGNRKLIIDPIFYLKHFPEYHKSCTISYITISAKRQQHIFYISKFTLNNSKEIFTAVLLCQSSARFFCLYTFSRPFFGTSVLQKWSRSSLVYPYVNWMEHIWVFKNVTVLFGRMILFLYKQIVRKYEMLMLFNI